MAPGAAGEPAGVKAGRMPGFELPIVLMAPGSEDEPPFEEKLSRRRSRAEDFIIRAKPSPARNKKQAAKHEFGASARDPAGVRPQIARFTVPEEIGDTLQAAGGFPDVFGSHRIMVGFQLVRCCLEGIPIFPQFLDQEALLFGTDPLEIAPGFADNFQCSLTQIIVGLLSFLLDLVTGMARLGFQRMAFLFQV